MVPFIVISFLVACGDSSSETQTETSPEIETTEATMPDEDPPVPTSAAQTTVSVSSSSAGESSVVAPTSVVVVDPTTVQAEPADEIISFGDKDSACESVKLTNASTDAAALAEASKCFMDEFEAEKAVTVDIARPTVEGDPIFYRYFYNGNKVLTIEDTRADPFGDNSVVAKLCDKISLDGGELLAADCEPADSLGFSDALG